MALPVPASRNAPCPCGSGKRYKDCHGALGIAPAASIPAAADDAATLRRAALLQDALTHQQAGDLAAAMARYEAVLADAPDDFDALHMLGVVCYQRHDFDRADALLRAAIARNPRIASAQQNLALVLEARRLEAAEDALCRRVLPRMAHLCAPAADFAAIAKAHAAIDLLDGREVDRQEGEGIGALFARMASGALGMASVHAPIAIARPGATADLPTGALLAPVAVLFGVATPVAAFPPLAPKAIRVLVVDRDAPSALHDRLRELSDDARHRVHVRSATPELAAALGVPGGPLFELHGGVAS